MSMYRQAAFIYTGLSEFTKNAYLKAEKHFNSEALNVDLKSKVAIVTGANSGIGKMTTLELAKRGAKVYMLCRDPKRSEEARQEILAEAKVENDQVVLKIVDMSDLKAVVNMAEEISKSEQKLDVLVNNAGCMVNERKETADGLELNFATNTVGTYALTVALMPLLANQPEGSRSRVVTVSSGGMYTQRLDVDDLNFLKMKPFDGTMAYAQNKRQQVILTDYWAQRLASAPISFYSCHPGWADTPAVRSSMPDFYEKLKNRLRTETQGADTIYWLSIAKPSDVEAKFPPGSFFQDRQAVKKHFSLAWTHEKPAEVEKLVGELETILSKAVGEDQWKKVSEFRSKHLSQQ